MRKKQSFFKGLLLLTAAGIIVKIIGFVYRVVLTNLPGYGDEGNGIYGAGYQVYLLLFALSTTGFPSAISKMVAEKTAVGDWRGAHKIFKVAFWLLFASGLTISLIFFAGSKHIARLISNPGTVYTMVALSPTIFFVSIMAVFRGYFQGMQDMGPQANSQIIEQLAKTVFTIILAYILIPYGVEYAAAGATLGTTIGAAVGAVYLWNLYSRRKIKLWANIRGFSSRKKTESTARIIANLLKLSLPISLGAVILTVGNIIDLATVMKQLGKAGFDSGAANRLYGILTGKCYVLAHFPITISAALATSLVPAISASVATKDYKAAEYKISAALRLTMIISLPSAVGMALLADPILKLLFPGTSEGAYLLLVSAFTIIFAGMTQTISGILQGLGHAGIPAASLFAGALFKLAVNYATVPIPHINIKGAVYGTITCYLVSTVINYVMLKRNFKLNLSIYDLIIKPVVSTIVMGITVYYLYPHTLQMTLSNPAALGITVPAAAGVFGFMLLLLGGINARDISMLPFGQNIGNALVKLKLLR